MTLKKKLDAAGKGIKKAKDYVAPFKYVAFEEHLKRAKKYEGVQKILDQASPEERSYITERLKKHLYEARKENRRLKFAGAAVDTLDKTLVPVDVLADTAGIIGGLGYGVSVAKEAVEMPAKIANSVYYATKTGSLGAMIGDAAYELASFIIPGSLLDLTNRYANRVDKYVAKEAARRVVKEIRDRKEKRKKNLVDITEEFSDDGFAKAA